MRSDPGWKLGAESGISLHQNVRKAAILSQQYRLQPDQFQQCKEHADDCALRSGIAQQLVQPNGRIFHAEPPPKMVGHLPDGYRILFHIEDWTLSQPFQNLVKDAGQVHRIRDNFAFAAFVVAKLMSRRPAGMTGDHHNLARAAARFLVFQARAEGLAYFAGE
jgi:hypothetical protein